MFIFITGTDTTFPTVSTATGTDDDNDTEIVPVASTKYLFEVKIDAARIPRDYINGAIVSTGDPLTAGITTLKPFVGVAANGESAAKAFTITKRPSVGVNFGT